MQQRTYRLLLRIEAELKHHELWQEHYPEPERLASQQPFAVDTLAFHQWLQFIFLPRMHALVEGQRPLPKNIGVSPMAAQVYSAKLEQYEQLVEALRELDILLSGSDPLAATGS